MNDLFTLQKYIYLDNAATPHVVTAPNVANNFISFPLGTSLANVTTETYIYITSINIQAYKSNGAQFLFSSSQMQLFVSGFDAQKVNTLNPPLICPPVGNYNFPYRIKVASLGGFGFTLGLTGSGVAAADTIIYIYTFAFIGESVLKPKTVVAGSSQQNASMAGGHIFLQS